MVEVFGSHALIQRCREHKKRNVTEALPERLRATVRSAMSQAYVTRDPRRARRLLDTLARVLSSSNLIENLFSRVREIGRRVRHWQSGTMVLRWTAAGALEAERGFRKLTGYRAMPALVAHCAPTILIVPDPQLTKPRKALN
jgi:putative transposase